LVLIESVSESDMRDSKMRTAEYTFQRPEARGEERKRGGGDRKRPESVTRVKGEQAQK
jgi:hypothetical protein